MYCTRNYANQWNFLNVAIVPTREFALGFIIYYFSIIIIIIIVILPEVEVILLENSN